MRGLLRPSFLVLACGLLLLASYTTAFAEDDGDGNIDCPSEVSIYTYVSGVGFGEKVNGKLNLYGKKCVVLEGDDKAAEGTCTGPKSCKAKLCDGKPCKKPDVPLKDTGTKEPAKPSSVQQTESLKPPVQDAPKTSEPSNTGSILNQLFDPKPTAEQKPLDDAAQKQLVEKKDEQPGLVQRIQNFFSPTPAKDVAELQAGTVPGVDAKSTETEVVRGRQNELGLPTNTFNTNESLEAAKKAELVIASNVDDRTWLQKVRNGLEDFSLTSAAIAKPGDARDVSTMQTTLQKFFAAGYTEAQLKDLRNDPVAYAALQNAYYEAAKESGRLHPELEDKQKFFAFMNSQVARESTAPTQSKTYSGGAGLFQVTGDAIRDVWGFNRNDARTSDGMNMLTGMTYINKFGVDEGETLKDTSKYYFGFNKYNADTYARSVQNGATMFDGGFNDFIKGEKPTLSFPYRFDETSPAAREWEKIMTAQASYLNTTPSVPPPAAVYATPESQTPLANSETDARLVSTDPVPLPQPNPVRMLDNLLPPDYIAALPSGEALTQQIQQAALRDPDVQLASIKTELPVFDPQTLFQAEAEEIRLAQNAFDYPTYGPKTGEEASKVIADSEARATQAAMDYPLYGPKTGEEASQIIRDAETRAVESAMDYPTYGPKTGEEASKVIADSEARATQAAMDYPLYGPKTGEEATRVIADSKILSIPASEFTGKYITSDGTQVVRDNDGLTITTPNGDESFIPAERLAQINVRQAIAGENGALTQAAIEARVPMPEPFEQTGKQVTRDVRAAAVAEEPSNWERLKSNVASLFTPSPVPETPAPSTMDVETGNNVTPPKNDGLVIGPEVDEKVRAAFNQKISDANATVKYAEELLARSESANARFVAQIALDEANARRDAIVDQLYAYHQGKPYPELQAAIEKVAKNQTDGLFSGALNSLAEKARTDAKDIAKNMTTEYDLKDPWSYVAMPKAVLLDAPAWLLAEGVGMIAQSSSNLLGKMDVVGFDPTASKLLGDAVDPVGSQYRTLGDVAAIAPLAYSPLKSALTPSIETAMDGAWAGTRVAVNEARTGVRNIIDEAPEVLGLGRRPDLPLARYETDFPAAPIEPRVTISETPPLNRASVVEPPPMEAQPPVLAVAERSSPPAVAERPAGTVAEAPVEKQPFPSEPMTGRPADAPTPVERFQNWWERTFGTPKETEPVPAPRAVAPEPLVRASEPIAVDTNPPTRRPLFDTEPAPLADTPIPARTTGPVEPVVPETPPNALVVVERPAGRSAAPTAEAEPILLTDRTVPAVRSGSTEPVGGRVVEPTPEAPGGAPARIATEEPGPRARAQNTDDIIDVELNPQTGVYEPVGSFKPPAQVPPAQPPLALMGPDWATPGPAAQRPTFSFGPREPEFGPAPTSRSLVPTERPAAAPSEGVLQPDVEVAPRGRANGATPPDVIALPDDSVRPPLVRDNTVVRLADEPQIETPPVRTNTPETPPIRDNKVVRLADEPQITDPVPTTPRASAPTARPTGEPPAPGPRTIRERINDGWSWVKENPKKSIAIGLLGLGVVQNVGDSAGHLWDFVTGGPGTPKPPVVPPSGDPTTPVVPPGDDDEGPPPVFARPCGPNETPASAGCYSQEETPPYSPTPNPAGAGPGAETPTGNQPSPAGPGGNQANPGGNPGGGAGNLGQMLGDLMKKMFGNNEPPKQTPPITPPIPTPQPQPRPTTTPPVKPLVTLIANPTSVESGGKSRLSWASIGVTQCNLGIVAGLQFGQVGKEGSTSTPALATTTIFGIECSATSGATTSASTTVRVR